MSNDNLNNRIINNVRNKIIISNIKGEKEKISSFVVKADGQEKELQPNKEENGYVFYEYEKDDKKI